MPNSRTTVACDVCGKKIGRKADLARHMKTHATNKEELMHSCPFFGCPYKTLQHTNLATHLNVHTGARPKRCPVGGCDFVCSDPGSLTRHRKEMHGYVPRENSSKKTVTGHQKAARQRPRISPYTRSSSATCSTSVHGTPRPQLIDMPPSSAISAADYANEAIKNSSAAYSTRLIAEHAKVGSFYLAPNIEPSATGLSIGPGASAVGYQQPQGELYAVELPDQPGSSLPPYVGGYDVDNTPVASHPSFVDGYLHALNNAALETYPSYYVDGYNYSVDNTGYELFGYSTAASRGYSFTAPDMGVYNQLFDQTYLCTPAPADASNFLTQGLYKY